MNKIVNFFANNNDITIARNVPQLGTVVWHINNVYVNGDETIVESEMRYSKLTTPLICKTGFIINGDYLDVVNYDDGKIIVFGNDGLSFIGNAFVNYLADSLNLFTDYNRKNHNTFTIR